MVKLFNNGSCHVSCVYHSVALGAFELFWTVTRFFSRRSFFIMELVDGFPSVSGLSSSLR